MSIVAHVGEERGTGRGGDFSGPRERAVAWLSVAILLGMIILSSIDRMLIALLVDPIRADLGISDVQFSLLTGFAFVIFYAAASVPMGWLGDRYSRRWVIFGGVASWSLATALCGRAATFGQLFVARVCVGVGEATLSPCAYAIVGDLFPRRLMARAIGVLGAGTSIGAAVALGFGGLIVAWAGEIGRAIPSLGLHPWQLAFLMVGLPGIAAAPLVFLIPRQQRSVRRDPGVPTTMGYFAWLRAEASYLVPFFLGGGLYAALTYGAAMWLPAFIARRYGLEPAAVGGTLGLVTGIAGVIGFVGSGWLIDRMQAGSRKDAHFRFLVADAALSGVAGVLAFGVELPLGPVLVLVGLLHALFPIVGVSIAHLQLATPPAFRGRTIGLLVLSYNLVGMSLGPTAAAFFSDRLFGGGAGIGAGIAMLFALLAPLACLLLAVAIRPARRAVARNEAMTAGGIGIAP